MQFVEISFVDISCLNASGMLEVDPKGASMPSLIHQDAILK